ncbi:uncharacterized protein SPPG_01540 [Spizellomyces punctatus DAOM BR117]|uniref:NADH:flavin oxidoreductase/NADH oxidase N-terminal domain-containing protein n=1 Tax=Spizellomyces punctatus (strain DAOM BR117) TaxID=645134 RepID=A0A0L0HTB0_SPIPD|nr:uncharacterized protein SPPG_01540 [Spizellomyces punctatus DAOM BR117]KND04099.1 hypothetical protein SPPG_01540 [Spizellomyces punctatus DAOM BR117]|eukprot:XP_016612138.1 hypothetical protein SPPG_01540 [Spizellomyces punctatus DAOM BR117]
MSTDQLFNVPLKPLDASAIPVHPTGIALQRSVEGTGGVPLLFKQIKIRDVQLKNRVIVSPMCQYSAVDGFMNTWHMTHLGQFATRGAGLVIFEASAVKEHGRITPNDAGIYLDEHIAPMAQIVAFLHTQGTKAGLQLAHAGRKASCYSPFRTHGEHTVVCPKEEGGWPDDVIGPSPIQQWEGGPQVREATKEDIRNVIKAFGEAAKRADKAGFDVVEIHGAHGYLINSFLSPLSNQRTDEYGGSFENRIRLLLEITEHTRSVWPASKPLFVRLSCTDWADGGWTGQDTVRLVPYLRDRGVDLIDCSSGGNVPWQKVPSHEQGWNVPFSRDIKQNVKDIMTGPVGGIVDYRFAECVLQKGEGDVIFMAREFLRHPTWVLDAADDLEVEVAWPVQYERSKRFAHGHTKH